MVVSAKELIRSSVQFYRKHLFKSLLYLFFLTLPAVSIGLVVFFVPMAPLLRQILSFASTLLSLIPLLAFIRFIASQKQQIDIGPTRHQLVTAVHLWRKATVTYIVITAILLIAALPLLFPAIFLSVWLAFCIHVVALEGKGMFDAVRMSRNLSKWRWWSVAWRLFIPLILYSIIAYTPFKLVMFGAAIVSTTSGIVLLIMITLQFLAILWIILVAPLLTITTTLLYLDLSNHPLQEKPTPERLPQLDV